MRDRSLPSLSICQPWATAILTLGKMIENREWGTKHRGPLVIHAAKKSRGDPHAILEGLVSEPTLAELTDKDFPLGAILGVVDLVDCRQHYEGKWADARSKWYWLLANPRCLQFPIPCNGHLRLWEPPANAMAALRGLL